MNFEVEFLAVGDKTRAGDSIIVRYGEEASFRLMVVDGGTAETGEKLVAHLKKYFSGCYPHGVVVEHVVLTHSDADHASGLRELLKEIRVLNLWLHIPWFLSSEAIIFFQDKRWTPEGLSKAIKDEYPIIAEIVELAIETGCKIHYPFQGAEIGPFTILSPSRDNYLRLLPQFEKTPEADKDLIEALDIWIGKESGGHSLFSYLTEKIQSWIEESWENERLKDGGVTSASNESSVVMYADAGEQGKFLLTGDAGIRALTWAKDFALKKGFPMQNFSFVQIPHHGSRRNVGPSILNEIIGPILPRGTSSFIAYVSAPVSDDKHPRKIVLNAFMRRGGQVIATQGTNKIHWGGFPPRADYSAAVALPFQTVVEDYD